MIDDVIAFEVNADSGDERQYITALKTTLLRIGKPFMAYYAPFEFVVKNKRDYDMQEYRHDRLITLYNLDFCGEISGPIKTIERERKYWRVHAIRQIIMDQESCYRSQSGPNWFILLITTRDQMDVIRLKKALSDMQRAESVQYRDLCSDGVEWPERGSVRGTHSWALKAFTHDELAECLVGPNISTVFFPLVKYVGKTAKSPMLHWMLFCQFDDEWRNERRLFPRQFLTDVASVRALDAGRIVCEPEPGETTTDLCTSSVDWFKRYEREFQLARSARSSTG